MFEEMKILKLYNTENTLDLRNKI